MTEQEQIQAARNFAHKWTGRGNEESDYQIFWLTLLRDIFGVEKPEDLFKRQEHIKIDERLGKIDLYMPRTKVLIEQKSFGVDLLKPNRKIGDKPITPYEQAKRYADNLPYSERPRWIITCNFSEFHIYDMKKLENPLLYFMIENIQNPDAEFDFWNWENKPVKIKLEDLPNEYKRLNFLVDPNDENIYPEIKISKSAADIVKKIYAVFEKNYLNDKNFKNNYSQFIDKICTRLVFCFYAGDANIFTRNQFFDYLESFDDKDRNDALQKLFEILDTPENLRDENISEKLKKFPYVNGGLFKEKILLPSLKGYVSVENPINSAALYYKNKKFSWRTIDPTIFGSLFESVLNPATRRKGGMHYTSIENIHKVIDPLFMDDLHAEFKILKKARQNKVERLKNFQNKIASLKFFDPACGSGNFLTETFLSLRKLENEVIRQLNKNSSVTFFENPVKVSINQFFGIEINDFAVAVAQVALWIAENQMLQETEKIIARDLIQLPLKSYPNIFHANALQIDWSEIISPQNLNYIIGNPPFVGTKYQTPQQKADVLNLCKNLKPLDYVTAWYFKADQFIQGTKIKCAFVSTNSISQGEQVAPLWKILSSHIDFCHKTFKWQSESEKWRRFIALLSVSVQKKIASAKLFSTATKKFSAKISTATCKTRRTFTLKKENRLCKILFRK